MSQDDRFEAGSRPSGVLLRHRSIRERSEARALIANDMTAESTTSGVSDESAT
jgi:hypothetical protein